MALGPWLIAILIIILSTETRPLPKCCKIGINTLDDFHGAFPKQTGFYGPNEARGLIAIVIIMLSSETRPLPKCSFPCSKTGIITSDDFCWCVSKADGD